MSALEVFKDEIAHLVLTEQKTRQEVFDHLIQKYGSHKGLSFRNVKRFCQTQGYHRINPNIKNKNPIAAGLRKAKAQVLGTEVLGTETGIPNEQVQLQVVVTEFPNNCIPVRELSCQEETLSNQDHEYVMDDTQDQSERDQKVQSLLKDTGEKSDSSQQPPKDPTSLLEVAVTAAAAAPMSSPSSQISPGSETKYKVISMGSKQPARMSTLQVFEDEIAHLVLTEQKTRQEVYDHLVQKYGTHKGLSYRNVKRYCQAQGYHRIHPNRINNNPVAAGLRKAKAKVLGTETGIANEFENPNEQVQVEEVVTEFPNNCIPVRELNCQEETLSNQDHEYVLDDTQNQSERDQKGQSLLKDTGEKSDSSQQPPKDPTSLLEAAVSAATAAATALSTGPTPTASTPTSSVPSASSQTSPGSATKYRLITMGSKPMKQPARKRKIGGTTVVVGEQMTDYQRQKLQKMDAQNQHLKTISEELQILRTGLFAMYDIRVAPK